MLLRGSRPGGILLQRWTDKAKSIKRDLYAVYLACRDPRTPWYARLLAVAVIGYALSPIDLIPDFIPVIGYLDDLILVPLGLMLVVRLIPPDVLADARRRADASAWTKPRSWLAAAIIVLSWIVTMTLLGLYFWSRFGRVSR